ncbi:hypothetical protein [Brevibacillus brevis]|uniref:hypothetical protein n=1 Tax=Brevibacillus brevis TaxID=1393 RepID=UPI001142BEE1|nr:hypothetical protein [Brevibacillus brevis]
MANHLIGKSNLISKVAVHFGYPQYNHFRKFSAIWSIIHSGQLFEEIVQNAVACSISVGKKKEA